MCPNHPILTMADPDCSLNHPTFASQPIPTYPNSSESQSASV